MTNRFQRQEDDENEETSLFKLLFGAEADKHLALSDPGFHRSQAARRFCWPPEGAKRMEEELSPELRAFFRELLKEIGRNGRNRETLVRDFLRYAIAIACEACQLDPENPVHVELVQEKEIQEGMLQLIRMRMNDACGRLRQGPQSN